MRAKIPRLREALANRSTSPRLAKVMARLRGSGRPGRSQLLPLIATPGLHKDSIFVAGLRVEGDA